MSFDAALPIVDGDDPGLRFPGQWVEAETGLLQNWHRDWDPSLGYQFNPYRLVTSPSPLGGNIKRYGRGN